jgi:hypothetical protein
MRWKILYFCGLVGVGLFAVSPRAEATNYTWGGANPGNWNVKANWSPSSGFPTATDSFSVGTGEVSVNDTEAFSSGSVGTSATATGILDLQSGAILSSTTVGSNVLAVNANGTLDVDSGGSLSLGGEIRIGNSTTAGDAVVNQSGGMVSLTTIEMGVYGGTPSYNMSGGALSLSSGLDIGKAVSAVFNQTGGSVTTPYLLLTDSATTPVSGSYSFTAGSLNATTTIEDSNGHSSGGAFGVFQVNGSGIGNSITTPLFSLTYASSELVVGLDGGGSTLIAAGKVVLTNETLDLNALNGFTGAGDVTGHPGWYRLASYSNSLADSGLTLTSDTGLQYSIVSDPGYLTVDVVPEPTTCALLLIPSLFALGRRRRCGIGT